MTIRITYLINVLLELDSSVNLFPPSTVDKYDLGEVKPASMILKFKDKSKRAIRHKICNVTINVEGHYFPINFLTLNMKISMELSQMPIILGRLFLCTVEVNMCVDIGVLMMKNRDQIIPLQVFKTLKYPIDNFKIMSCYKYS